MLSFHYTTTATTTAFSLIAVTLRRISLPTMSTTAFQPHAFAGNSIKSKTPKSTSPISPIPAYQSLIKYISNPNPNLNSIPNFKVLPFRKGRPLTKSESDPSQLSPKWQLGWVQLSEVRTFFLGLGLGLRDDMFVYLGGKSGGGGDGDGDGDGDDEVYWGIDVSDGGDQVVEEFGKKCLCFVELRTLMVATDWSDVNAMADLAIAGHARSLLEWHGLARFCGHCGSKTVPMEAGRRVQCSNELCKKRVYPRVDPVVIMLVIDRENDRALLSRQSRFVPRMWSCLAGFLEPGESLEEAVRRETWEETGIEVGEVVYHSSQPWPVGPSSMPCQLMVGFFAFAKSTEINVDKEELEDARWHSRDEVKKAISVAEYEKAQRTSATKVDQMCKGVKPSPNLSSDYNTESGELAPMFIPGPYAIAHHLISSWVFQEPSSSSESQVKQLSSSLSNL